MGRIEVSIPGAHLDGLMAGEFPDFLAGGSGHRQPGTESVAIGVPGSL